jgi:hypothetical protein
MEKIINLPVFLTATIKGWKPSLKPDKYKIIVLNKLKNLLFMINYSSCLLHHASSHTHYMASKRGY